MKKNLNKEYFIFLPVRNGEKYIQTAIESVLAQAEYSWRLVVFENCSTDSTLDIIGHYQDERISIIPARIPLSIRDNWNRVLEYLIENDVKGVYCTIIGHDDYFLPSFLSDMGTLIDRYPDATLYQTSFDMIGSNGDLIRPCRPIPDIESGDFFIDSRCWGLRDSYGTGYVFRAEDYRTVGGMPDLPLLLFADDLLFYRLAKLKYKASSSNIGCAYRLHRASASSGRSTSFFESQIAALRAYVDILLKDISQCTDIPARSASISALLARDMMIFENRALKPLLPAQMRADVNFLEETFHELSRGVLPSSWVSANLLSRKIYNFKLIFDLFVLFGRQRISSFSRQRR
jgi:hypothetical protein